MLRNEFHKWFHENIVKGETDTQKGIYNYTIGDYSFTAKPSKSNSKIGQGRYLSLYANGKVCATRIYDDDLAVYDSIYRYLYKKMAITNA